MNQWSFFVAPIKIADFRALKKNLRLNLLTRFFYCNFNLIFLLLNKPLFYIGFY